MGTVACALLQPCVVQLTAGFKGLCLPPSESDRTVPEISSQSNIGGLMHVLICMQVLNADGEVLAMKLHRLGRTSFRAVKKKRDYLQHRNSFRCCAAQPTPLRIGKMLEQ